ncbi:MAG: bifunctional phosphoribosyl-AMP cyclohydrolase/phosphoribosyl-ATP diphosphatase HisIE [Lachnospiraceae bacterium]|nr:bifunctional phosphoribosyl-AMP cyclohydrolase/phosphoribosyl-ATP diphosphatase HisIE [Lachnospiraceae bacterium]
MDYIRIVSQIDRSKAVESAVALDHAGADELYFIYEGEQDLETIKAITRQIDTPVCVRMSPERFEDVKKVLYAGATTACLMTRKEEVIKEVVGRFGAEKISGMIHEQNVKNIDAYAKQFTDYGYGQLYVETEDAMAQKDAISNLCTASTLPVLVHLSDETEDYSNLSNFVKVSGVQGIVVSAKVGLHTNEMKQAFLANGLQVNTFESAIPFSEFKLNSDGLIPVVVQDYKTNEVLMVAYMNEESYQKTIETGMMTYYSRSRQELWLKGDTSGHYQYVKSLSLDCDNDTILAKVEQVGAACHTGEYSCFFKELVKKDYNDKNPLMILKEDYDVIAERKMNPKEGSYTNYLFDKGIDKILKKVGEEATEIVIAAKNPDAEELKYEISDFLYHVMVLMVECGLTWEDITNELVERR